jgi:hypothetical protein
MSSKSKLKLTIYVSAAILILAILYGIFGHYSQLLSSDYVNNMHNPGFRHSEADINKLIEIQDISKKRHQLIDFIWGKKTLPSSSPSSVVRKFTDSRYANIDALAQIDKLIINMEFGLESVIYHFIPKTPNNKFVFYHQGHRGDFHNGKARIEKLLDNGYSVFAFCMPLMGLNNQPTVILKRLGKLKLTVHDHMKFLEPKDGHQVKYFIEPVIVVANYIDTSFSCRSISMIGISGGAWTTILAAAVDIRITKSFPVAGSYPIFLRTNHKKDWGDYEQTIPELYNTANYLELYVLGSVGDRRIQFQIFNKYDPCCFAGTQCNTYKKVIENRVRAFGTGSFGLLLDDTHNKHMISPAAMHHILKIMKTSSLQP